MVLIFLNVVDPFVREGYRLEGPAVVCGHRAAVFGAARCAAGLIGQR